MAERYVSRAGLKLASVAKALQLDFQDKIVLDVGSSTGGFTDYALQHGAEKVIAVDSGTNQLHPSLRGDPRIELHEKTDVRGIVTQSHGPRAMGQARNPSQNVVQLQGRTPQNEKDDIVSISGRPDLVLIDVSFISLRGIIPHVSCFMTHDSVLVALVKPQFEANAKQLTRGVVKNNTVRRQIFKDFEQWVKRYAVVRAKTDSELAGASGNRERFYTLQI